MIKDMFNDEFSKWTLTILNEDLNVEWALTVIKSKQNMILTGAIAIFFNDVYFDYYWNMTGSVDFWIRLACNFMILCCILFIYVFKRDLLKVE